MTTVRKRRSTEQVRNLLLTAARDLFAERGFSGTTTREIAIRAGVDQTLLFRHFGNKERMFQEAVARPIDRFLREYTEHWLSVELTTADPEEMLRSFAGSLYDLAASNRALLLAATPGHLGHGAQAAIGQLQEVAVRVAAAQGLRFDAYVAVRAAVAMVITVSVFDEPLFGASGTVDRDRVVDELVSLLTYGLTRRPGPLG